MGHLLSVWEKEIYAEVKAELSQRLSVYFDQQYSCVPLVHVCDGRNQVQEIGTCNDIRQIVAPCK